MSTIQPVVLVRWATTGNIVEPDEAKKSDGWVGTSIIPNEKPRYQFDNWFKNSVGLLLEWLRDNVNLNLDVTGAFFEITYDPDDKITNVIYFDSPGKVTTISTVNITYDSDDKITIAEFIVPGVGTFTQTLTYDADDKIISGNTVIT